MELKYYEMISNFCCSKEINCRNTDYDGFKIEYELMTAISVFVKTQWIRKGLTGCFFRVS